VSKNHGLEIEGIKDKLSGAYDDSELRSKLEDMDKHIQEHE
jgi:hypothetical protein